MTLEDITSVFRHNLIKVFGESYIETIDRVLAEIESRKRIAAYHRDLQKFVNFAIGGVMKQTGGRANPGLVRVAVERRLIEQHGIFEMAAR